MTVMRPYYVAPNLRPTGNQSKRWPYRIGLSGKSTFLSVLLRPLLICLDKKTTKALFCLKPFSSKDMHIMSLL